MKIQGKTFVVTGGASGLGEATVRKLYNSGANIVILDLNESLACKVIKDLTGCDDCPQILYQYADVTDEKSTSLAFKKTIERFKRLDGLINCAGVIELGPTTEKENYEKFLKVISVNLSGTYNATRLAFDVMKDQEILDEDRGVIIMTSSIAAFDGLKNLSAYSASKAAIAGMTLPLAREFSVSGVRVMSVAPGPIETPLLMQVPKVIRDGLSSVVPYPPRCGLTSEFAQLCAHIIENAYLNGETIRMDGGLRMPL
ncbi:hypothetical protein DFA_05065 [Cavenderia fasciculata]|uniref:Ketoreductase domain-containing protein n=1 Tax=Cavenderia fasciculata TaxID=261658 RepID=F4PN82_CACFS|nr:uncharacterized protein DFA_05065 [Cavenderia fasciculata]EGG22935.1 hypothetical protein DFA_05065 [Cavenderia fasciculata]|eukprot:XP_004360786.1 hypothetical protein DFA_05065 [Cavenderia fasciculata]